MSGRHIKNDCTLVKAIIEHQQIGRGTEIWVIRSIGMLEIVEKIVFGLGLNCGTLVFSE